MGEALDWVSRIFSVVIVMVGPGLLGQWLDHKFGLHFLATVGFVGGLLMGMAYLIWLVGKLGKPK